MESYCQYCDEFVEPRIISEDDLTCGSACEIGLLKVGISTIVPLAKCPKCDTECHHIPTFQRAMVLRYEDGIKELERRNAENLTEIHRMKRQIEIVKGLEL